MFTPSLIALAEDTLDRCRRAGVRLATAESCTGGLIAGCLTEIAGSSDVVDRGFVTYSNDAKMELLGVASDLLDRHGAVSKEVAEAMALGARQRSPADIAVAVTGIAGPGGGSTEKPVGLVHLAIATKTGYSAHVREVFSGDRHSIRMATVERALHLISEAVR